MKNIRNDSTARPKLLFLVHRVPFPPDKGDRIRTYQFLRFFAERADVYLACLADEPVDDHVRATLNGLCKRVAIADVQGCWRWARAMTSVAVGRTATEGAFSSAELRAVVCQWTKEVRFDVAVATSSSMMPYLHLPELAELPAVVDLIDVDSQKWFDFAASSRGLRSWLCRLEGRRLRRLEQRLPSRARAVTLVSEAEVAIYRQFCADGNVQAVGNGVDLDYFQPQPVEVERGCVFLGALDYWPNVEGISWFCREVWPQVRRRHPEATLKLVGRRPTAAVSQLQKIPGVELVGQVPDVRPYLAGAALSVVPLRIARGVQNKVLESMAMGKATVVSPQALEGLSARPGEHLLTASTPEHWLETLTGLFQDPLARQRLGSAGRNFTEANHHWARCLQPLEDLLGLTEALPRARASA